MNDQYKLHWPHLMHISTKKKKFWLFFRKKEITVDTGSVRGNALQVIGM